MKAEENHTQEVMEPTTEEEIWALFYKQREAANWSSLFEEQAARTREYWKGVVLPDELRLDNK